MAACSDPVMRRRPSQSSRGGTHVGPGAAKRPRHFGSAGSAERTGHERGPMSLARITVAVAIAFAVALLVAPTGAMQSGVPTAPSFEVDPFWPKPLPNH